MFISYSDMQSHLFVLCTNLLKCHNFKCVRQTDMFLIFIDTQQWKKAVINCLVIRCRFLEKRLPTSSPFYHFCEMIYGNASCTWPIRICQWYVQTVLELGNFHQTSRLQKKNAAILCDIPPSRQKAQSRHQLVFNPKVEQWHTTLRYYKDRTELLNNTTTTIPLPLFHHRGTADGRGSRHNEHCHCTDPGGTEYTWNIARDLDLVSSPLH